MNIIISILTFAAACAAFFGAYTLYGTSQPGWALPVVILGIAMLAFAVSLWLKGEPSSPEPAAPRRRQRPRPAAEPDPPQQSRTSAASTASDERLQPPRLKRRMYKKPKENQFNDFAYAVDGFLVWMVSLPFVLTIISLLPIFLLLEPALYFNAIQITYVIWIVFCATGTRLTGSRVRRSINWLSYELGRIHYNAGLGFGPPLARPSDDEPVTNVSQRRPITTPTGLPAIGGVEITASGLVRYSAVNPALVNAKGGLDKVLEAAEVIHRQALGRFVGHESPFEILNRRDQASAAMMDDKVFSADCAEIGLGVEIVRIDDFSLPPEVQVAVNSATSEHPETEADKADFKTAVKMAYELMKMDEEYTFAAALTQVQINRGRIDAATFNSTGTGALPFLPFGMSNFDQNGLPTTEAGRNIIAGES